jgi:WD40 repeat protein
LLLHVAQAAVNCIAVKEDGSQCASASSDGSAIVWDLRTYKRVNQLLDSTVSRGV